MLGVDEDREAGIDVTDVDQGRRGRRVHLLLLVLSRSGVAKVLGVFLAIYLLCALVVQISEPDVTNYGDALWFLWAVSTTVGLGDLTATTPLGRVATVICSLTGMVSTAILMAVAVDYYNERRKHQLNESLSVFLDKLEHLRDLSREDLDAISERVRQLRH